MNGGENNNEKVKSMENRWNYINCFSNNYNSFADFSGCEYCYANW